MGIGEVVVVGEISNFKTHTSGHRYYTLKDADSQISCTMWRSRSLTFEPTDGMLVQVKGRLSVYPPRGSYQIDVIELKKAGVGDLYAAFEKLKKDLALRGWFDAALKKPLPAMPMVIGIATSPTGAAVQDMLTTIRTRFPLARVIFRPTLVQGDGAAEDIALAIRQLHETDAEVLIIGRGGGSIEDLWAFNTEIVATAIHDATLPIISAVGHETDTTIADFVADLRAPTPTAAAVYATPRTVQDMLMSIDAAQERIVDHMTSFIEETRDLVDSFVDGTAAQRLTDRIMLMAQRVDDQEDRALRALRNRLRMTTQQVEHTVALLAAHHPLTPLRKGFAVVERAGVVLQPSVPLEVGERVTVRRLRDVSEVTITATTNESLEGLGHGNEEGHDA
jgi:exodeoxyribonuclease VII large subunit